MRVRFGDFVLDRGTRQLLKSGEPRPLEPKAYQLLDLLISRRPAAVSKQEIRDGLWPDTFVSESHLSSLAARVRRALDAGAEGPGFVRTVHGFGYAFTAEATEEEPKRRPERVVAQIEWDRDLLPLMEGENVIGRGEEVSVRIDAEGVSRRHARIVADGGRFTLEDLGSKNGTYLREQRLARPAALEDGDAFRLGRTVLVFRVSRKVGTTILEG
ncbi:MAG TPA: FHA domain-containing protein [Vicinamibacteria bacterium]